MGFKLDREFLDFKCRRWAQQRQDRLLRDWVLVPSREWYGWSED